MWKLLCLGAMLIPASLSASLLDVRSIYILPMGSSLDQHLAQTLARDGRYEVVTDPQRADAVLTDKVGESFERKLDELYPRKGDDEKDSGTDKDNPPQIRVGGFSRARGTVFLVDRTTRAVLWSDYAPPQAGSHDDPHKRAQNIVNRLHKETDKLRKHQAPAAVPSAPPASSGVQ